jgi:hypothetical protein
MNFNRRLTGIFVFIFIMFFVVISSNNFEVYAVDNSSNQTNSSVSSVESTFLTIKVDDDIYVNQITEIKANYSTNSGPVIGVGVCSIENEMMGFNMTHGYYFYPSSFDYSGNYTLNIECNKNGFENKSIDFILEVKLTSQTNQTVIIDSDNDGYEIDNDCDDNNNLINPGMAEVYYNSIDDDCNPNTLDFVYFNVTTDKQSYAPSQVVNIMMNAVNKSDTYITINTPTNVSYVYIFSNGSYPIIQQFSLTTLSGQYSIEAVNYLGNYTNSKVANFNVDSTFDVNIQVNDDIIYEDEELHFVAQTSGSIGDVNLVWNLDDGSEKNQDEFDHVYSSPGIYNVVLIATDEGGNQVIKTKEIMVKELYYLKVKVIDNATNEIITDAIVELDNDDELVNLSGMREFRVSNETYDLDVVAPSYIGYDKEINVTESRLITVKLDKDEEQSNPVITLISPLNNSVIKNPEFKFKFIDNKESECTLFVSDDEGWWIEINSSQDLESGKEYVFKNTLDEGSYLWRIHCKDTDNNLGVSDQYVVNISELASSVTLTSNTNDEEEVNTTFSDIQEVFDLIPDFSTYTPDERKVVEYLNMEILLKDAKRKLEMANRDIYNLRKEASAESFVEKQAQILIRIAQIRDSTPMSVTVTDKSEFVKYIDDEDFEKNFDLYLEANNIELTKNERKALLKSNLMLQKKVSIQTNVYQATITYISGRSQEITLVSRRIDFEGNAKDIFYVEFVPDEVSKDISGITFVTNPDNIDLESKMFELRLSNAYDVIYYFGHKIPVESFPKIIPILVNMDLEPGSLESITGFAVFDNLGFSESNKKVFLVQILIVFVLLSVYLGLSYKSNNGFNLPNLDWFKPKSNSVNKNDSSVNMSGQANYQQTNFKKEPQLNTVNYPQDVVSMNAQFNNNLDIKDHHKIEYLKKLIIMSSALINKDIEAAALKYHEIKFLFELLDESDKQIVHEDVVKVFNELTTKHISVLVDDALVELAQNNQDNAHGLYGEINAEFDKLAKEYQTKIYKRCCELAVHLKK